MTGDVLGETAIVGNILLGGGGLALAAVALRRSGAARPGRSATAPPKPPAPVQQLAAVPAVEAKAS
jgi:hypothetical protein